MIQTMNSERQSTTIASLEKHKTFLCDFMKAHNFVPSRNHKESKRSCFHQKYQNGFAQCEVPLEIIERRRGRRGQKKVDIYAFTKAKIMDVVIVVDLFVQHLFSCVSPVSCHQIISILCLR